MKTKAPASRRKFTNDRDKMDHLYQRLIYWLYERKDRVRARGVAEELSLLLSKASPDDGAIFPEECWSLICEARGDLSGAIKHRENEIRLIKRLHEISRNSPQKDHILRLYGPKDLSDRLDLLAMLYHEVGNPEKAVSILEESKRLCKESRIEFDGDDLLREYTREVVFPRQEYYSTAANTATTAMMMLPSYSQPSQIQLVAEFASAGHH